MNSAENAAPTNSTSQKSQEKALPSVKYLMVTSRKSFIIHKFNADSLKRKITAKQALKNEPDDFLIHEEFTINLIPDRKLQFLQALRFFPVTDPDQDR